MSDNMDVEIKDFEWFTFPECEEDEYSSMPHEYENIRYIEDLTAEVAIHRYYQDLAIRQNKSPDFPMTPVTDQDVERVCRDIPPIILEAKLTHTLTRDYRRFLDVYRVREHSGFMVLMMGDLDVIKREQRKRRRSMKDFSLHEFFQACYGIVPIKVVDRGAENMRARAREIFRQIEPQVVQLMPFIPQETLRLLHEAPFCQHATVQEAVKYMYGCRDKSLDMRTLTVRSITNLKIQQETEAFSREMGSIFVPHIKYVNQQYEITLGPMIVEEKHNRDIVIDVQAMTVASSELSRPGGMVLNGHDAVSILRMTGAEDLYGRWSGYEKCKVVSYPKDHPLGVFPALLQEPKNPCQFTLRKNKDGLIRTFYFSDVFGEIQQSPSHYVGYVSKFDGEDTYSFATRERRYIKQSCDSVNLKQVRSLEGRPYVFGGFCVTENDWRLRVMMYHNGHTMSANTYAALWELAFCLSARNELCADLDCVLLGMLRICWEKDDSSYLKTAHYRNDVPPLVDPLAMSTSKAIMDGPRQTFFGGDSYLFRSTVDGFEPMKRWGGNLYGYIAVKVPKDTQVRICHTLPSAYFRAYMMPIDVDVAINPYGLEAAMEDRHYPWGFKDTSYTVYRIDRRLIGTSIDFVWFVAYAPGFLFVRPILVTHGCSVKTLRRTPGKTSTATDIAVFSEDGYNISNQFFSLVETFSFMKG